MSTAPVPMLFVWIILAFLSLIVPITYGFMIPWNDADARQLVRDVQTSITQPCSYMMEFTDPDGFLSLSPEQKKRFYCWARPSEIVRLRYESGLTFSEADPVIVRKNISPFSIKQQYVQNCSFIASLCICAAFEQRFRKKLITSIFYPQTDDGRLLYNPEGKYMIKLWVNGMERAVVIDDYLPIDKHGNLLCSNTDFTETTRSTNVFESELELWVCLIEKAYMKLCGGYDFKGSNSGVDLFALTGWIPERIIFAKDSFNIKDYETDPERVFQRILSAIAYGDCLITVSTDVALNEMKAKTIGLVSGHAYAVLDVVETSRGMRFLRLKNPWADESWKGRYSAFDMYGWNDLDLQEELGYDPYLARQEDDGVFWVCWEDILEYFQNFYLSWNPYLFKHRRVVHGYWPYEKGALDDSLNVGENPQYVLSFSRQAVLKRATLWLLISRHVNRQEQWGTEPKDFLTVHLHRNTGPKKRVWYAGKSGDCVQAGLYTNSPHVLIRYDVEGNSDTYLSAILSQYRRSGDDLGYTLSCFCTEDFSLNKPEEDLEYVGEFTSGWTRSLSGGPVGQPSFNYNPMFALNVPEYAGRGATVQMTVTTRVDTAINVMCFPVPMYGCGVEESIGEAVVDSGNYRYGFTVTERESLRPGDYVVIVSNYHEYDLTTFKLKVYSSTNLIVEAIN